MSDNRYRRRYRWAHPTAASVLALLTVVLALVVVVPPAYATRLPPDLSDSVHAVFPDGKVRIDGAIQTSSGEMFLPLLPPGAAAKKRGKVVLEAVYPEQGEADVYLFSNGWFYMRVLKRGIARTLVAPASLPEKLGKQLLACRLPSDLIVPDNFVLPQSLRPVSGELVLKFVSDATMADPNYGKPRKTSNAAVAARDGYIFLTSLTSGTITLLDDDSLSKVVEFPTEGTPSSLAWAKGKLYISDQAKNRILILDPERKQFLGQIDLPHRSAPKGLAVVPAGHLLYVAESGANAVAVIEVDTGKVLLRTKVPAGPSRMAVTPNGNFLIVLNVPSGQCTIMSTLNQKVMGTIPVGVMPTDVAVSADGQTAYITNRQSNSVSVVDIAKRQVSGTIATGAGPTGIALSKDDSKLFVAHARDNSIGVYDAETHEKLQDVRLPLDIDFPGFIYLMPDGKRLLVSSEATDTIGVLNLKKMEFENQSVIGHSSHDIIWVPK